MKKALSLVLAVILVFSLCACAGGEKEKASPPVSDAAPASESPSPSAEPSEAPKEASAAPSEKTKTVKPIFKSLIGGADADGYINDEVDYMAREKYQFQFVVTQALAATSDLYDAMDKLGAHMNYKMDYVATNNDDDTFMTTIETLSISGSDGFVLSPNVLVQDRVTEIANETGVPYILALTPFRNAEGQNMAPVVCEDDYTDGKLLMKWLLDNYKSYWPDATIDDIGLMPITYSGNIQMQLRVDAAVEVFLEEFPGAESKIFTADTLANGISMQSAYDECAAVAAAHSEVKYWLVPSAAGLFANGAARAFEAAGIDKNCLIISVGIQELFNEWNAGYDGCWAACVAIFKGVYAVPFVSGLVAMADGRATMETLWSDRKASGDKCTCYIVEAEVITVDNYKEFEAASTAVITEFKDALYE